MAPFQGLVRHHNSLVRPHHNLKGNVFVKTNYCFIKSTINSKVRFSKNVPVNLPLTDSMSESDSRLSSSLLSSGNMSTPGKISNIKNLQVCSVTKNPLHIKIEFVEKHIFTRNYGIINCPDIRISI